MSNIKEVIENFLIELSDRQREVVESRFGLKKEIQTLASIGEKYGLTRERVRQIEAASLGIIREKYNKSFFIKELEKAVDYFNKIGGIRKENDFINDIKNIFNDPKITKNQAKFIFEISEDLLYRQEDDNFYSFWYFNKDVFNKANNFINKLEKFLDDKKEEVITLKKFDELFAQVVKTHNLNNSIAVNYISISKKFGVNPYGDFGLMKWEEINPKTAKSRTYLILKKHKISLHFKEIANKINEMKLGNRKTLFQTVHNELIKDPRFVLVGRGTYGLAERGVMPGTAKEVIARILKNKGPLPKEEVVDLVKQERMLKENTILLNLQNKKHFKKLSDGRYRIV